MIVLASNAAGVVMIPQKLLKIPEIVYQQTSLDGAKAQIPSAGSLAESWNRPLPGLAPEAGRRRGEEAHPFWRQLPDRRRHHPLRLCEEIKNLRSARRSSRSTGRRSSISVGDGSFGQNAMELDTAVRHK